MLVGSFVNHLIHPLTYTAERGEERHFSSKDIARVTVLVLSSLALTAFGAFHSSRSLKTSVISIGMITGAVFYLATAVMKKASRDSDLPPGKEPPKQEPGPSKQGTGGRSTPKPSEDLTQNVEAAAPTEAEASGTDAQEAEKQLESLAGASSSTNATSVGSGDARLDVRIDSSGLPPEPDAKEAERSHEGLPAASSSAIAEPPGLNGMIHAAVPAQKTYQQLTVTADEVKVISDMIRMIGDTWMLLLLSKEGELLRMGKQIAHVHPLKFLETVLNNSDVKKSMISIKNNTVKWRGFLRGKDESPGFIDKCTRENDQGNFAPHLADFCKAVKVDYNEVRPLVYAKKWEEFIRFLVSSK